MKRHGQLYEQFTSFQNLLTAYKKARKGAVGKKETQWYSFYLERELLELQEALISMSYHPAPYRYFEIHDPKYRIISVASFRDRVVHHALINLLEPIYEPCFIFDSYATRKEKGTHKAIDRAQQFIRQAGWFWKSDIDKYFDSIRHKTLLELLGKKIKDPKLMLIAARIIQNGGKEGVGLPIGNLTSQFFANVYLNPFDHYIKETLGIPHYIRYMDDFVLFDGDRERLKKNRPYIKAYLKEALGLEQKSTSTYMNHANNGLTFLGRRIFPATLRIARPNARRMLKRMKEKEQEYTKGLLPEEAFLQSMNSYWAQLEPFLGLRSTIIKQPGKD